MEFAIAHSMGLLTRLAVIPVRSGMTAVTAYFTSTSSPGPTTSFKDIVEARAHEYLVTRAHFLDDPRHTDAIVQELKKYAEMFETGHNFWDDLFKDMLGLETIAQANSQVKSEEWKALLDLYADTQVKDIQVTLDR